MNSIGRRRSCSGFSLPDVFNTLQIYLGSLYVNDFNLFGHTFPRHDAGGHEIARLSVGSEQALRPQQRRRHDTIECARRA